MGRLDWDSEGLLLLTNDGSSLDRFAHPSYEHPRSYAVLVEGEPTADIIERWKRGITLDGRMTRFDEVTITEQGRGETWLQVTVHEGRKHLVRRMVAALGFPATRLIRSQWDRCSSGHCRQESGAICRIRKSTSSAEKGWRLTRRRPGMLFKRGPAGLATDRGRYATRDRSSARGER